MKRNLLNIFSITMLVQAAFLSESGVAQSGHYVVSGLETLTALARTGTVTMLGNDGAIKGLSNESIKTLARLLNDATSYYDYSTIKKGNDAFCCPLDMQNNFRYTSLAWMLQDAYLLVADLMTAKNKSKELKQSVAEKNEKKIKVVEILGKILPWMEGVAALVRAGDSLRATGNIGAYKADKYGIASLSLDYCCTAVISLSRILEEMIAAEKFSVRQVLAVAQSALFFVTILLDIAEKTGIYVKNQPGKTPTNPVPDGASTIYCNITYALVDSSNQQHLSINQIQLSKNTTVGEVLSHLETELKKGKHDSVSKIIHDASSITVIKWNDGTGINKAKANLVKVEKGGILLDKIPDTTKGWSFELQINT